MQLTAKVVIFDDTVMVRTPYIPAFVDALKWEIHGSARRWDAGQKIWEVDPLYKNLAIEICKRYFDVEVDDQTNATQRQLQAPAAGNWADALFDAIDDPDLRTRVYRKVAAVLHPDANGDLKLMQEFTEAYARRHKS